MDSVSVLTLLAGLLIFASLSKRIANSPITGPIFFVVFGFVFGPAAFGFIRSEFTSETAKMLAELTLVFVLFTDSSKIQFGALRRHQSFPERLLGIGLPLTIVIGFAVALLLLTELSIWEAAILAVIVAPTDAALGQAVVENTRVPEGVRRALSVESGLNDGICVPALSFTILAAAVAADFTAGETQPGFLILFAKAIGLGVAVGILVAFGVTRVFGMLRTRGWIERNWEMLSLLATPLLCYVLAEHLGGSGFIAAFVAGMTMGNVRDRPARETYVYAEASGDLLGYFTWVVFGAAVVGPALEVVSIPILVYAALSLTLVRMLPVALALTGTPADWQTKAFIGWFGPRGLASIVFAVIVVNDPRIAGAQTIVSVAAWTILLSVFAHGLTASTGSRLFADTQTRGSSSSKL